MARFIIQKRFIKQSTDDVFLARYKNHDVSVKREPNDYRGRSSFYIQVTSPSGMYAYHGYWGYPNNTMEQAIEQALIGSGLLPKGTK